jgi:hypothetical protein
MLFQSRFHHQQNITTSPVTTAWLKIPENKCPTPDCIVGPSGMTNDATDASLTAWNKIESNGATMLRPTPIFQSKLFDHKWVCKWNYSKSRQIPNPNTVTWPTLDPVLQVPAPWAMIIQPWRRSAITTRLVMRWSALANRLIFITLKSGTSDCLLALFEAIVELAWFHRSRPISFYYTFFSATYQKFNIKT